MKLSVPSIADVASTLFWFLGVWFFLMTLSIGIPAMTPEAPPAMKVVASVMLLFGLAYCSGGIALRRWKWRVHVWAPVLCSVGVFLNLLVMRTNASPGLILLNVVAFVLIIINWWHMRDRTASPGSNPGAASPPK